MEIGLLRTLTNREFYVAHRNLVKEKIFRSNETRSIKRTIDLGMKEYEHDLTPADIEALFWTKNGTLTTAQKNVYHELFQKIENTEPLNVEVVQDVLRVLNREDAANELAEIAFKMSNGEITSLHRVLEFIDNRENDFLPALKVRFESMDIDSLLAKSKDDFKWTINISSVAKLVPGVNAGQLILGAARPNTGKTSSHAYLCAGPNGFLAQGAKVLVLANEEAPNRVAARYLVAGCGMPIAEIPRNRERADQLFNPIKKRVHIADATGWDLDRLERAVKAYQPDILVVDIADKVQPEGRYTSAHEQLKAIYIRLRIVAKQYNCAIFAMSQLSAEAEGKVMVDMSMLEGSRTGKASEADVLFCLTKTPMLEGEQEGDRPERHWIICKNKLTGRHGRVVTMFDPLTATFQA
tara:strand:- start:4749 stop:5975 length:1227 start_codon:yes stop_codon:yes gene_type:complete